VKHKGQHFKQRQHHAMVVKQRYRKLHRAQKKERRWADRVAFGVAIQVPFALVGAGSTFAAPSPGAHTPLPTATHAPLPRAAARLPHVRSRYVAPDVAVILTHARALGLAQAAQARAITEQGLAGAMVERLSSDEFDVVITPVSGYAEARVLQAAQSAQFLHVTIESPADLAAGTIIPGSEAADLGQAPQTNAIEDPANSLTEATAAPSTPTVAAPSTHAAVPSTYTVVAGDCLWTIAAKELGNPYKWPQLAAANHLSDPNLVYPGQVLQLVTN
jgi:nucleoid-associated protein YgaU